MITSKQDIRLLSLEEIETFITDHNFPKYRAKQIWEWIWKKQLKTISKINNLPKPLISIMDKRFTIYSLEIKKKEVSKDGSIKYAFKTYDNHLIEGVLIPSKGRITACVSSQVGCSLTCKFCATGTLKLQRNLSVSEIFDQAVAIQKEAQKIYKMPLSNIVFMGMGEPLLNYKNTLKSIALFNSELTFSQKRITVSTAGIAKMIKQLGNDHIKFNLALSLHAGNDTKRSEIMPINETNSLQELKTALAYFHEKTRKRITFEYIIFKDFNDSIEDAKELARFTKIVPCKINIIEYNPIKGGKFGAAENIKTKDFANFLREKYNLVVTIRRSKGKDINAACGQLVTIDV